MSGSERRLTWPRSLLLVCGHPCCFKSTITRHISFCYEVFAISSNETGSVGKGYELSYDEERRIRYENLFRITEAVLQSDLPLVVDGTFKNRAERERLCVLCRQYNYDMLVLFCYSSNLDVILRRFAYRQSHPYGPDHGASTIQIYEDVVARFVPVIREEYMCFAAYAEIDSATKDLTIRHSGSEQWTKLLREVEENFKRLHW